VGDDSLRIERERCGEIVTGPASECKQKARHGSLTAGLVILAMSISPTREVVLDTLVAQED
jgi:hypothetical protein